MKKCHYCSETRPLEDFAKAKGRKHGRASTCKFCKREMDKRYHAKFYKEKIKPQRQTKEYRVKTIRWKYGLSVEQVEQLMERSGGLCEICRESVGTCIDHDHACCPDEKSCGKCVRGLLCRGCNWALGHMRDNPERLRAAASYLEIYSS